MFPVCLDIPVTREAVEDFIMYYPGINIGLTGSSITLDFTFALQCISGAEAILQTLDLIALDSTEGRRVGVITIELYSGLKCDLMVPVYCPHVTSNVTLRLNRLHSLTSITTALQACLTAFIAIHN